jgi:RecB family exonuclease
MSLPLPQLLTNSRMQAFKTCARLHFFRYEVGLRPIVTAEALRIGTAFHAGLDARAKGKLEAEAIAAATHGYVTYPKWASTPESKREWDAEAGVVGNMLAAYFWFWERDDIAPNLRPVEVVASELAFSLPLRSPTGRKTRSWRLAGKMDKIVRLADGRLALMEHKTTTDSVAPDSDYWPPLRLDAQISLYFKAAKSLGYDIDTILYDVASKPSLRPYNATPLDKRKYKKDGTLYANQRDTDESIDDYAARVWADITAAPETYFARQEIPRTSSDLADFDDDLWALSQLMHTARKNSWHPRNPSACRKWGRLCEHAGHCATFRKDGVVPSGFEIVEDCNPELEGAIQ